jgi:hypothetical protein
MFRQQIILWIFMGFWCAGCGSDDAKEASTDSDRSTESDTETSTDAEGTDTASTDTDSEEDAGNGDDDSDGVLHSADNCPVTKNASQDDRDHNGTGDACEPVDLFAPRFQVTAYQKDQCSNGVTVLAVQGGEETFEAEGWLDFGYVAGFDMAPNGTADNEILPLWVFADSSSGPFSDVNLLPNGNLLTLRGSDAGAVLTELDPVLGTDTVVYDDVLVNHSTKRLPDGSTLFIYSEFFEDDILGVDVDGDGIREIRRESARVVDADGNAIWDWSVHEQDPSADATGNYLVFSEWWSNCNAVSFVPSVDWEEGQSLTGDVYLNCRLLDRLYKINYPTGNIEWIMGNGGDFGEGFTYHSHDPEVSFDVDKDGKRILTHILIYDNREKPPLGDGPACPKDESCPADIAPFSRVIQVDVDNELNAEIVWKWPSVDLPNFNKLRFYSPIGGGVTKLENGNLLITNATEGGNPFMGEECHARIIELKRDGTPTGGEIVWQLQASRYYGSYKAIRVPYETVEGWDSTVSH